MKSIWDISADLQAGRLKLLLQEWRCPAERAVSTNGATRGTLLDFLEQRFSKLPTRWRRFCGSFPRSRAFGVRRGGA